MLSKFWCKLEMIAEAYIDSESLHSMLIVKQISPFTGFKLTHKRCLPDSKFWTSIALSKNILMSQHTDDDFFLGAVSVLSETGFDAHNEILQYFCFPGLGISVPLRHGELIMFNPSILHCISSRVKCDKNVIVASLYLKTAVVGGNDKDIVLDTLKNPDSTH